jgi:hypothetical protein
MRRLALILLIVSACGGDDPLAGVENCSELLAAVEEHLPTIEDDSEALEAFYEEVETLGTEMGGDAIAEGNEFEGLICAEAVTAVEGANVRNTFDEIESGLS